MKNFFLSSSSGKEIMSEMWEKLIELIFPAFCLGCKRDGAFLCKDCQKGIMLAEEQCCPLCHCQNMDGSLCGSCESEDFYLDGVRAAASFKKDLLLERCIHALKYDFIQKLADPLGEVLFEAFRKTDYQDIVLCPVPLHRKRFSFRGFNQSDLLAEKVNILALQENLSVEVVQFLERIHFRSPQMELKREQRIMNMQDAFVIRATARKKVSGASILLIDDVATTLATLNSCGKVLKQAGAKTVYALVLARAYG